MPHFRGGQRAVARIALAATFFAAPGIAAGTDAAPDVAVKAAFLYNFAKFAEWRARPTGAPIVVCIVGKDGIADALVDMVRGQSISGHMLEVSSMRTSDFRFRSDSLVDG